MKKRTFLLTFGNDIYPTCKFKNNLYLMQSTFSHFVKNSCEKIKDSSYFLAFYFVSSYYNFISDITNCFFLNCVFYLTASFSLETNFLLHMRAYIRAHTQRKGGEEVLSNFKSLLTDAFSQTRVAKTGEHASAYN